MSYGFIRTVLPGVFSREFKAISGCESIDRNGVMAIVDIAGGPLLIVLDELVMEVTLRQVICAFLIVTYIYNHLVRVLLLPLS